jgi:hypothetical protein
MDEKTLQEWEALANATTPGPWRADAREGRVTGPDLGTVADCPHAGDAANTLFIAAAREAVPALVAEVRRLQSRVQAQRTAVEGVTKLLTRWAEERDEATGLTPEARKLHRERGARIARSLGIVIPDDEEPRGH